MAEDEVVEQVNPEMEQAAARMANDRAVAGRWNLDIAVFLFGVLIIVIVLLFQGVEIEIVAPVAIFGLAMVWLVGWRQGRQLYRRFYDEELFKLKQETEKKAEGTVVERTIEETIEEKVQKALRERWK